MSAMDVEKTIEFILEQQAQFQAQVATRMQQQAEAQTALEANQNRLAQLQLRQQEMIGNLATVVGGLAEHVGGLTERVDRLFEAQERTENNLNALIKVVDDLVRRNGKRS